MNPVFYEHATGLQFTTERLVSFDEKSSHDISVVCMWLPYCKETPMILVDWYCGEPNLNDTATCVERYVDKLPFETIRNLIECQDLVN